MVRRISCCTSSAHLTSTRCVEIAIGSVGIAPQRVCVTSTDTRSSAVAQATMQAVVAARTAAGGWARGGEARHASSRILRANGGCLATPTPGGRSALFAEAWSETYIVPHVRGGRGQAGEGGIDGLRQVDGWPRGGRRSAGLDPTLLATLAPDQDGPSFFHLFGTYVALHCFIQDAFLCSSSRCTPQKIRAEVIAL